MGTKLGVNMLGDNKDRALEPSIAAEVMYAGMRDGDFTSKKLSDYFSATVNDPVNARRIINGTDRAQTIAGYHEKFLTAFKDANVESAPPDVPTENKYVTREEFNKFLTSLNAVISNSIVK
jgi:hypothetical protein